jgi:hypothetical protein
LVLLKQTAELPYTSFACSSSSSSSNRSRSSGSGGLSFNFSGNNLLNSSSGRIDWSTYKLKELEAAVRAEQQQLPHVAAARDAAAVACLLAATNITLGAELQEQVWQLLLGQGAAKAAAAVAELDAEDQLSASSEEEEDTSSTATAEADGSRGGVGGPDEGPSAAALLKLGPSKRAEVELLTQLSFQFIMAKEWSGVAQQLATGSS